jgi:hypothetical protein
MARSRRTGSRPSPARVGGWVRVYQTVVEAGGEIELSERRAYLDDRLKLLEGRVLSSADRGTRWRDSTICAGKSACPRYLPSRFMPI